MSKTDPTLSFYDRDSSCLCEKFQLSGFKTEGGVWADRQTHAKNPALFVEDKWMISYVGLANRAPALPGKLTK